MRRFGATRWILPAAATVPLAAILFALALGPSPRKYLSQPPAAGTPSEATVVWLRAGPAGLERVLAESLLEPDMGTLKTPTLRLASMRFLAERHYRPAARVMQSLLKSDIESPEMKVGALRALMQLNRSLGTRWATRCMGQPDPLGAEAKALMDPSAQLIPN